MKYQGLSWAGLFSEDFERHVGFYRDVLGFPAVEIRLLSSFASAAWLLSVRRVFLSCLSQAIHIPAPHRNIIPPITATGKFGASWPTIISRNPRHCMRMQAAKSEMRQDNSGRLQKSFSPNTLKIAKKAQSSQSAVRQFITVTEAAFSRIAAPYPSVISQFVVRRKTHPTFPPRS